MHQLNVLSYYFEVTAIQRYHLLEKGIQYSSNYVIIF